MLLQEGRNCSGPRKGKDDCKSSSRLQHEIPAMSVKPESITTCPDAPAPLRSHERRERGYYRRITPGPVHDGPVVSRLPKVDGGHAR
jgi:hypothetical protein